MIVWMLSLTVAATCSADQARTLASDNLVEVTRRGMCRNVIAYADYMKSIGQPPADIEAEVIAFCEEAGRPATFLCGKDLADVEVMNGLYAALRQRAEASPLGGPLVPWSGVSSNPPRASEPLNGALAGIIAPSLPAADLASTLATGLADFMVARAEAELQLFIVDKIRAELCGADTDTAKYAINTCAYLGSKNDYFSPSFGPSFIAAVRADIERLPAALITAAAAQIPHDRTGLMLRIHLDLIAGLYQSQRLSDILTTIGKTVGDFTCSVGDTAPCTAIAEMLKGIRVIIEAAATAADGAGNDIPAHVKTIIGSLMGRVLTNDDVTALERIVTLVKRMRASGDKLAAAEPKARSDLSLSILGDFILAFDEAAALMKTKTGWLNPPQVPRLAREIIHIARATLNADYPALLTRTLGMLRDLAPTSVKVPEAVVQVLNLGASLGAVKTPEEATVAVESFAAPIGSWRLKRKGPGVYLNGMVGFSAGAELLTGARVSSTEPAFSGAFMGSLGLDVSTPLGESCTFGLYLSVIDVGPLASVRSDADQEVTTADGKMTEDAKVTQAGPGDVLALFAPGAYVRFGLGDSPAVLGLGATWVPAARAIRFEGAGESEAVNAVRFQAFIAIDVVILPLAR
jgi:hypothetical protein